MPAKGIIISKVSLPIRHVWLLIAAVTAFAACDRENRELKRIVDVSAVELTDSVTLLSADSVPFEEESFDAMFGSHNSFLMRNVRELNVSVFDSLGRQTALVGGRGEGPGSLAGLGSAFLFGDTLAVFDTNRQKVYLFLQGKLVEPSLDFSLWQRDGDERLQLAGRFGDGRWVAIHSQRLKRSPGGVSEYADTTWLLVGHPEVAPQTLLQLPVQTRLQVRQGNATFWIALDDVSPSYVSVCDSGVVVLDSADVKYFDAAGQIISKIDVRHTRLPFFATRRDGIVRLQMTGIEPGPIANETQNTINKHLDQVSQVLPPAMLDARGQVWLMHRASLEYERFNRTAHFDFAFKAKQRVLAIGVDRVLTMGIDQSTDLPHYALFRSRFPVSSRPPSLGWCQGTSAW